MLPVTHGREFTIPAHAALHLAVVGSFTVAGVDPHDGIVYGSAALILGLRFVWLVWQLRREYSDARSRGVFRYSLTYLAALFAVLLADHYLSWL